MTILNKNTKLSASLLFATLAVGMSAQSASAAGYPEKPIVFVVGNNPGSVQDLVARRLARLVEVSLKVPVPIENRPGGGGVPSWVQVKNQPADGYTITLTGLSSYGVRVGKAVKVEDFQTIGVLHTSAVLIASKGDGPYKTLADLAKTAVSEPGKISIAGTGATGYNAYMAKLFSDQAKSRTKFIPMTGGNKSVAALLGGHVDAIGGGSSLVANLKKSGTVNILAVATAKRHPAWPDVPTFKEQGFDIQLVHEQSIMVKSGTPADRVAILRKAFKAAAESEDYKKFSIEGVFDPTWTDGEGVDKDMRARIERLQNVKKLLQ